MKKILFASVSLCVGGIEKSIVTLLNELADKYDITLVLEEKQGENIENIDKRIKIIEYKPFRSKNILIRKFINLIKRINFKIKYKNKYDFSAAYATYSLPASFVARTASQNSVLWVHSEYMSALNNNKQEYRKFYKKIKFDKFSKIIFVSQKAEGIFNQEFKNVNTIVINNLINSNEIVEKSRENIDDIKKEETFTFLNVGRHTEFDKQLSYLIEAANNLKKDNMKFRIILIGEGKDTDNYKKMVKDYDLKNEILFLGKKSNPYPYFKISDCFILTSRYEGYPVVYNECFTLNLPIITTNVSDSEKTIHDKHGIVVNNNVADIYIAMKNAINNGIHVREKFDVEKYNEEIKQKLINII